MIREFIQNAHDAHAASIDFRLTVNAAAHIELEVDDDGIVNDQDPGRRAALPGWLPKTSGFNWGIRDSKSHLFSHTMPPTFKKPSAKALVFYLSFYANTFT
jgi:hypothetical protein